MKVEKLLIISWAIYPSPTGSSILVNNLAGSFEKAELVLLGEGDATRKDNLTDTEKVIYYVNPNVNIRKRGQMHLRWLKFFKIVRQVKAVIVKEQCTKVLCVFPDDFYLFASYLATKKLNVPLFTWFHNTYLDNYTGYRKIFARWFQPVIFQYAVKNFVMSEGMNDYFKLKYPNNAFEVLPHGFKLNIKPYTAFKINPAKVKFLYTGSFNESCRDATVRLIETIKKVAHFEIHLFTGNAEKELASYGISGDNVIYHGFVPLEDLYGKLKDYDIMLLPHGFEGDRTDIEFKTIFPTRTIPLLLSNRPILAHSPKDTFLTNFLIKHKCAVIVDTQSEQAILEAIDGIINHPESHKQMILNALEAAKLFDINKVSAQLKKAIEF